MSYFSHIESKPYPYRWLLTHKSISFKKSVYVSLIYLLIISILIIGIHFIILIKDMSKYTKFMVSLPFPLIIIFILSVNRKYVSLIITGLVGLIIVLFSSFHFFVTSNYPNIFSEICLFRERESFMFIPLWMLNLYLVAFPSILILYELLDYYYLNRSDARDKINKDSKDPSKESHNLNN